MGSQDMGVWNSMGGMMPTPGMGQGLNSQGLPVQMLNQAGMMQTQAGLNQQAVPMMPNQQQALAAMQAGNPQGMPPGPPNQSQGMQQFVSPQQQQQMQQPNFVSVAPADTFPVVRLRGIPFDCQESDIQDFFQGFEPLDILLCRKMGRMTGEAYVLFPGPMLADLALQKNRQNLGRRYVEVFRSKKLDYYAAVASHLAETGGAGSQQGYEGNHAEGGYGQGQQMGGYGAGMADRAGGNSSGGSSGSGGARTFPGQLLSAVLKMRGLPFITTKDDIIGFFTDPSIAPLVHDNIHIVTGSDGRATGTAFVEFTSPDEARRAMNKDRQSLGTRYVELFPSSREEATRAATSGR